MWDTRYRPLKFTDVLGQPGTVQLLKARLQKGTALDTSYIFSGGHGQGKCVVGDTLVSTDLGLVPILDLMGPNQIDPNGRTVLHESGTTVAAYSYRGGVRETIRVRTHHGFEIEGTPNHRILILNADGMVSWSRLDGLRIGDQTCLLPRGLFGEDADLSGFHFERRQNDHSSESFRPPSRMTPSLARLLGYFVGDGTCTSRKASVLSCAEPDIIEDQERLMKNLLGMSSTTPDRRRSSLVSIRCGRVQPRAFLAHIGLSFSDASCKEVPWSILRSSEASIREFLRGYLEADGGVVVGSGCIEFTSKSKILAKQIHLLLFQLGVIGRLYRKVHPQHGVYWRCQIYGTELRNFAERVGFISRRKQQELLSVLASARGLTRSVPHQKQHLRRFYAYLPSRTRDTSTLFRARKDSVNKRSECTEQVLRRAVQFDPENPVTPHFRELLTAGFFYSPVTSLEAGEAEVYDLNVPEGSRFAANGFINHNTTLARIYARAMLCLNLDKSDPEPCNECDNCKTILLDQPGAFSERDAASQGTIENIRAIVDELPFSVFGAAKRVYLFDEAHRMSAGAQDVLLKPVEEKKMVGIFCTTEPDKIRGPIRSRCEDYTIRKITREDVLVRMQYVLAQERVEYQDDAVLMIIDHSHGHVRDVINKMEMIAQLGPITVEGVREYLRLSVISLYYEILLSLNEPQKAISLVEQACERVAPEDVASGLAEAAMNSYRLSNGMFADFAYADRDLGRKVYAKYGAGTIVWAEYFLRSRYVSRISLLRDVLVLTQVPGNMPGETTGRPVLIPTATVQTPATEVNQTQNYVSQVEAPVQAPAAIAQTAQQGHPAPAKRYLTDLDSKFLDQREMPRGSVNETPPKLTYPGQNNDDLEKRQLDPDTWRREFELRWTEGG